MPIEPELVYRRSFTARYEIIGGGAVREATLSPDSCWVAFVRDNNLFVKELASGIETRITCDGERNQIINGATDWVYEEEYGFTRAYEWSADGRQIAYLRFDESRVREFTMMRYGGRLYPEPYTFKYPKAGEENSVVTLHVYNLDTGQTSTIDTGAETDQYIPRIGWTPSSSLFFYRVNRLQNLFEVVLAGGRVIYSESSPTYVERPDNETVKFSDNGDSFTVRNETRTGWWNTYRYSIERGYVGAEGSEKRFEPDLAGWNERAGDGRQFFGFTTERGTELYGWMLRPEGFSETAKYPVFMTQYSGPGSVSVFVERLSAGDMAIYQPLLDAGYVVVCVDGRGTGGRGEEFKKCTYGGLGRLETEDQISAARYLASLPFVDPSRIGIYGWSYGGFMALNCILKGADVFALAVAVAPVTSWRFYDTIYTEIYNGLPEDNPAGYDDNSPLGFANLLKGKLLLIHGTGDDNVHVQNSLEMARALVGAGKQFDMMLYTDDNHSMRPAGSRHVRQKIVEYVIANL
ncbi:MAG: DPP IV N-terminal domain-containing protein [Rikenellaceae bacterium]|nr:DPP IV N-terminal domain-containing protein [Rikenellaceae bacterium]